MKFQPPQSTVLQISEAGRQLGKALQTALTGLLLGALALGHVQAEPLQKIGDIYYETVAPIISPYHHNLNLPNTEGVSNTDYATLTLAEEPLEDAKSRALGRLSARYPADLQCGVTPITETVSPISYSPLSGQKRYKASTIFRLKREINGDCDPANLHFTPADLVYSLITWEYSCPHGYNYGPFDANGVITCRRPLNYCSGQCGNPVTHTSEKIQPELDYRSADGMLELVRTYHSSRYPESGWSTNFDIRIIPDASLTTAVRADGTRLYFAWNGSRFASIEPTRSTLTRLDDGGYRLSNASDVEEYYRSDGSLTKLLHRDGKSVTLERPASDILHATDSYGRKLTLYYERTRGAAEKHLTMAILPDGVAYSYQPHPMTGLVQKVRREGFVRQYQYDGKKLTGIIDENNQHYAEFSYGKNGAGAPTIGTRHANGVDNYQVTDNRSANGSGTVYVVEPLGLTAIYTYGNINGISRMTGISREAQGQSTLGYDANGNIASQTDFNGNQTTYRYDLARNLEISRTEGLSASGTPTPATRTIDTTWHPQWRLPTREVTKNAGGVAIRQTDMQYDAFGHMTLYRITDPVNNPSRSTRYDYRYSAIVPWHVERLTITGPRTDMPDTTVIEYWPYDAACPGTAAGADKGCRGNIKSVTNAKNQTSTYDSYDAHGRNTAMRDPNGLLTEMQYTARGWMTQSSVDGETTGYDYDGVGQLKTVTLPDGATLGYDYDNAQRLIGIRDNLGNSISYGLDNMGNRTSETVKDPAGGLKRKITRVYDNLSRLKQVTGAAQ